MGGIFKSGGTQGPPPTEAELAARRKAKPKPQKPKVPTAMHEGGGGGDYASSRMGGRGGGKKSGGSGNDPRGHFAGSDEGLGGRRR